MKCTFFHFKIPYFNQNFIFHYIHSTFYVSAVVSSPRPSASQSHVPGSFLSHSGTDLEQKKKAFFTIRPTRYSTDTTNTLLDDISN